MNPVLQEYFAVIRRYWRIVVTIPLIAVTLAALALIALPAKYESSAVLFVSTPRDDQAALFRGDMYAKDRIASYTALINSPDLAERVNRDLVLGMDPAVLSKSVSMAPIPGTALLLLRATGDSPDTAQRVAASYVEELRRTIASIETVPGSLTPRAELLVIQSPSFDTKQTGFPAWMIVGGAGGFALIVSCLVVVVISLLDGRVRRPEDVAEATKSAVLATFPASIPWRSSPSAAWIGETARQVRSFLDQRDATRSRVVLVTSDELGAGKTGTVLALARSLADRGSSVAVLDFDSRDSALAEFLGLSDDLPALDPATVDVTSPSAYWHGAAIFTFGRSEDDPGAAADSPALRPLVDAVASRFDWVIVDSPALSVASDAARISRVVGAVLLVARVGHTSFDGLVRASTDVRAMGGEIAGVVLVGDDRNPGSRPRDVAVATPSQF